MQRNLATQKTSKNIKMTLCAKNLENALPLSHISLNKRKHSHKYL